MLSIVKKANGNKMPNTFSGLVDNFFESNLNRLFDDTLWGFNGSLGNSNVPVNIRETDNAFEMELPLPGLKKEDLKVDVSNDMLTVSFEHKEENKEGSDESGWLRREFTRQSFSRSFNLGSTIDAAKIAARYNDGMLQFVLPKKEEAKRISKSIEIN